MANARDARQKKKAAKKKGKSRVRRDRAQTRRQKQKRMQGASRAEMGRWPISSCFVGASWHERGAHVYAILTRYHEQGRLASALFELDLEERGIIKAELRADWRPGEFEDFLGQLGEEIEPMEMCEPGLVVKLVEAAAELGAETLPEGYHAAHALCDGVAPDGPEILVGLEPTEETERPQEGLWSRMKKTMGFSKAP